MSDDTEYTSDDSESRGRHKRWTLTPGEEEQLPDFEALLEHLRVTRNFDFRGYKRAGLMRRVTKRMREVSVASFREYIEYLESYGDEFPQLFNTILINVTAFFRDDLPWEYMSTEIIPRLLTQKLSHEPIRVWCAGCATGEEAYTLAMVLAEAMGHDALRERVKLYATDVDEPALAVARQAIYQEADVASIPAPLTEKYFERLDQRYVFRKDLRRVIIFGRNDLVQDAPISRIDILACRNTLMYFDAATQKTVLSRFHFALNDGGFLFLGRAETLLTHNNMFEPVDLRRRVFTKSARAGQSRLVALPRLRMDFASAETPDLLLRDAAFDTGIIPQLVVDAAGTVSMVNERARSLFLLGSVNVGRPFQDLEVSYRPFELRSLIDQAYTDSRVVSRSEVPWRTAGGEQRWFDITVSPAFRAKGELEGAVVSFVEVTRHKQLQHQVEESQAELEAAYQELQSTNEELETTNEELHSTVEELETTNEELQSTNEELETMNEELQSTNEELQTINDELRVRSEELNSVNTFLESIFTSLHAGVAVVDRDLRILVWNNRAEGLWGLRADEAQRMNFLALDIGLPIDRLRGAIRACLAGERDSSTLPLPATNRRGRAIDCKVTVLPLRSRSDELPRGLIILMEELDELDGARNDGRGGNHRAEQLGNGADGTSSDDGAAGAQRARRTPRARRPKGETDGAPESDAPEPNQS